MWSGLEDKIFNTSRNENNIAIYLHYNNDNSDNRNITYRYKKNKKNKNITPTQRHSSSLRAGWSMDQILVGVWFFYTCPTSLLHKWFLVIPKGKAAGVCINHPPLPSAKVRQSTATPLFLLSAFITDYGVNFTYTFLPLPRLRSSLHLLVFLYTSAHQSSQSQSRLHNH